MEISALSTFAAAFFIFAASPGPDNIAIVARTLSHGARSGIAYGVGTVVGILTFLTLAVVGLAKVFATGVALNLGNPKMPLFYVALLPNFVGTKLAFSLVGELAIVIVAIEIVVIGAHVLLAVRARNLLRSPRIVRRANRVAGSAMIGAGAAVVASR